MVCMTRTESLKIILRFKQMHVWVSCLCNKSAKILADPRGAAAIPDSRVINFARGNLFIPAKKL